MSNQKLRELPIPPEALTDPKAFEIARIWGANDKQHVSLYIQWDDPAIVGLILVDLARHAANYYQQTQGHPIDKVLARIKEGFDAEWDDPTTPITGETQDGPPFQQ